jgi:lipopolysaccharide/colanic/teichoic acid biosynthesis glycosyltransferase
MDELTQLWNVMVGDMSLVGPRPQVEADASLYTEEEMMMLEVRPGITDLASIVFSDEGDILAGSDDPNLLYNQIIRPWKSRLALSYLENRTLWLDLKIILLTIIGTCSRSYALAGVTQILKTWKVESIVVEMASRKDALRAAPPPGATDIIQSVNG